MYTTYKYAKEGAFSLLSPASSVRIPFALGSVMEAQGVRVERERERENRGTGKVFQSTLWEWQELRRRKG